ncbi:Hypothetical_protein [Hexamita inflata]|uniref:Hypothetical_protein n=1 Tax=Hexamita inflata TaxID=28002 RepID=A0AA86UM08_9EUKA|nr:Hypothetical protein HINF_LOCUS48374 [Hexamita inflata]
MLTFLYSVQVCTKNVSVKIINEQFVLSFDNLCPQFGASVSVRIEANFPNGRNTFNKKIFLNENRSGSGTINCSNAQWGMSCEETIRGLKQNFEADFSFVTQVLLLRLLWDWIFQFCPGFSQSRDDQIQPAPGFLRELSFRFLLVRKIFRGFYIN